jgi:hypothetical protein
MRPRTRSAPWLATLALIAGAGGWGCGSDGSQTSRPQVVPAKGTVLYKGRPLTSGSITFEPEFGPEAHGNIEADGSFTLTSFKQGDGAVTGTHRVGVTGSGKAGTVPLKYRNTSSSKVEVDVVEGKSDYAIELK